MAIQLVPMTMDDYKNMIALWKSLPGIALSRADESGPLAAFIEKNGDTCFILKEDATLIGTVLAGSDGRRGYIYHLAVDPKFQNRGLGRKLVRAALEALRKKGIQKSHLFVIKENLEGIRFWHHLGWDLRDDVLIMSKNLIEPLDE